MSSYASHGPTFWENADPVPRNVKNVECDQGLHAEWYIEWPEWRHRASSITAGAELTCNIYRTPDTSFYGSIKKIYNLPDKDGFDKRKLYAQPQPGFDWTAHSNNQGQNYELIQQQNYVKALFAMRRTWTYPDRLGIDDEKDFGGESSVWKGWMDPYEFSYEGEKRHE